MRRFTHRLRRKHWAVALLAFHLATVESASAHHPNRETQEPRPRIDVIGPVGNRLPPSYRRRYQRPTHIGGKIAYWIAPSSQEAMAWHRASHRGDYRNHAPRVENIYFFPKPWEAMQVGPRRPLEEDAAGTPGMVDADHELDHDDLMSPVYAAPMHFDPEATLEPLSSADQMQLGTPAK